MRRPWFIFKEGEDEEGPWVLNIDPEAWAWRARRFGRRLLGRPQPEEVKVRDLFPVVSTSSEPIRYHEAGFRPRPPRPPKPFLEPAMAATMKTVFPNLAAEAEEIAAEVEATYTDGLMVGFDAEAVIQAAKKRAMETVTGLADSLRYEREQAVREKLAASDLKGIRTSRLEALQWAVSGLLRRRRSG